MEKNKKRFGLFIVLAIIQLAVAIHMIWRWENILQTGQQYLWITAPVDPYDALRGRYVDLRFKETKAPIERGIKLDHDQKAYAIIAKDEQGYAFIHAISDVRPIGNSYVTVKVSYVENDEVAHFVLPFKRYYMQEDLAPAAELAYRKNAGKEGVVLVRIKDGYGVLEQLYIGDKTIYEYLRQE